MGQSKFPLILSCELIQSAVGLPLFLVWKSFGEPGSAVSQELKQRGNHRDERKD